MFPVFVLLFVLSLYLVDSYDVFVETCTCNSKDGCNFGLSLSNNYFDMALIMLLGLALTFCH